MSSSAALMAFDGLIKLEGARSSLFEDVLSVVALLAGLTTTGDFNNETGVLGCPRWLEAQ